MQALRDQNYLLYHKGFLSGPAIGLMPYQGSVLLTKNHIFFVADTRKDMGNAFVKSLTFGAVKEGEDTPSMLENLVLHPELTVEGLEQWVGQYLAARGENYLIYNVHQLEKFENKTGLFGSTRLQRPGEKMGVLQVKKVKNVKNIIHDFYAN